LRCSLSLSLSLSAPSVQDYAQVGPPKFISALDAVMFQNPPPVERRCVREGEKIA